jgi:fatty acid desaturase
MTSTLNETIAYGRDEILTRQELKPLVKRTDRHGLAHFAGHTGTMIATGYLVYLALGTWWVVPATLLHGVVMAFLFAPVHECSHRTPFRTLWLNEAVYWFYCLIYLMPATYFRYSHATHHTYTQMRGKDPDMVLPEKSTVWDYVVYISGIPFWMRNFRWYILHALGHMQPSQRYFLPENQFARAFWEARLVLLIWASIAVAAVYTGSWAPLTLWLIPRVVGEPVMRFLRIAEHAECPEGPNLLINTRTTRAPPWLRALFWNMPFHAEHHIAPMVPFHALPAWHAVVGGKMYPVADNYFAVHKQVLTELANRRGVTWVGQNEVAAE